MLLIMFFIASSFFFNDPPTTEIYTSVHTLSLHDALPISRPDLRQRRVGHQQRAPQLSAERSEEHTSELQSRTLISYAVFCLKKKNQTTFRLSCSGCARDNARRAKRCRRHDHPR